MKRAAEFLLGGALVYVAMAANAAGCSAAGSDDGPLGAAGQAGAPSARAGASGASGAPGAPAGSAGAVARAGSSGSGGAGGTGGGGGILDPVPDADAATPGSRLKPKTIVAADGSKQPTTLWHDSERNEECAFQKASDGVMRCLPTGAAPLSGYYSNPECTEPMIAVPHGACSVATLPDLMLAFDQCGAGPRVHRRGEVIGVGSPYMGGPGACYGTQPGPWGAYTFYRIGEEIPLASFVSADLKHD